ncbi:MAG: MotA/TolQ/ExbB proton channel family protein [bacterium]|nr:MotA/TolQ/ExbB proton channel family protein [bacterium]
MFEILNMGGWIMYAILSCSIIAFAVVVERGICYIRTSEEYNGFLDTIKGFLSSNDTAGAIGYAGERDTGARRMALAYLSNLNGSREKQEEILYQTGSEQVKRLEQRLSVLSAIAHLAPLMGLLGTVLGMIDCFREIESLGGLADVTALAGGIWTALLTTAFGLIVAIPVAAVHHFFENLVDNRSSRMQHLVSELNIRFERSVRSGLESGESRADGGQVETI